MWPRSAQDMHEMQQAAGSSIQKYPSACPVLSRYPSFCPMCSSTRPNILPFGLFVILEIDQI